MAPPKSRLVIKVERDDSAVDGRGVIVTVKSGEHGNYSEPQRVSLGALSGQELMRVGLYLKNAGYPVGDTRQMDLQERLTLIQGIVKAEGYVARDFVPMPRKDREQVIQPPTREPEPMIQAPFIQPVTALPEPEPVTLANAFNQVSEPINEPVPTYAPGSLEAIIADIASRVSPKVDTAEVQASVTAAVMDEVKTHLAEIDALPRRVVIVTPVIESELPRLSHKLLPDVVTAIAAGNHVFLTGPAGSGKSTIAEQAFAALGKSYNPMSCDPSMMRTAIFGFVDANGNYHSTPARSAYEVDEGGLLVDEMERLAALQYASDSTHALVSEWIDYVQGLRRRVNQAGVKVLVTPRATIAGSKLITSSVKLDQVKEWTVLAGMTDEIRGKVEA